MSESFKTPDSVLARFMTVFLGIGGTLEYLQSC